MSLVNSPQLVPVPKGTILDDRFEILELLGAGSFGEVYHARQVVFGHKMRDVAVKLFKIRAISSANAHDVFNDVIMVMRMQEQDPQPEVASHIVQIYDVGMVKTPTLRPYMTMKIIPGRKTLESAIRRYQPDGMPVETALRFLRQLLVPLAWMHALDPPVVHGDLKPDNILMTEKSDLVLTDFGMAAHLPLGTLGGAIQYQAPETLLGQQGETPSDMYGVGLVWYEMLSGRHPFRDVGLEATAQNDERRLLAEHSRARKWSIRPARSEDDPANEQRIVPVSETNEEMREHPQLEAMLNRCLAYLPSQRYANARLLLTDIDRYVKSGIGIDAALVQEPAESPELSLLGKTPTALVEDSRNLFQQGCYDQAIAAAKEAVQMDAGCIGALLALARAYAKEGQMENAKTTCTAAQRLAPQNPEVFEAWADIYDVAGKPAMAGGMRQQARQLRDKAGPRS